MRIQMGKMLAGRLKARVSGLWKRRGQLKSTTYGSSAVTKTETAVFLQVTETTSVGPQDTAICVYLCVFRAQNEHKAARPSKSEFASKLWHLRKQTRLKLNEIEAEGPLQRRRHHPCPNAGLGGRKQRGVRCKAMTKAGGSCTGLQFSIGRVMQCDAVGESGSN